MKLFINNIQSIKSKPVTKHIEWYLTYDGIYQIKNNKIIQYSLVEEKSDMIIHSYVKEETAHLSFDELKYVATHDSLPNEHNKISIVKKIFPVTKDVTYIEEIFNTTKNCYFETKLNYDSELLKKTISTFISNSKSIA